MLRLAVASVLLATLLAGCAEPPRPNVLLIVVDTLRRDHLGIYGYHRDTSPHIDRFAGGAVRYEHAYAAAPWTTPSVGSLLTSRYPRELGITSEPDRLDDRFVLLSEVLAAEGYATGAVVSHYFLNRRWNFDQGFDWFDESNILDHTGISSPGVTDSALGFLRQQGSRPFFLFVHYFDPHYDYFEHEGFRFSDPGYQGPIRSGLPYGDLVELIPTLTPTDRAHLIDLYDSEIAFTDAHLGRLLAALDELGLADDTVVVLTADHGEEFLERGGIGHGHALFEEQIAVPLIIRYPGGGPGIVEPSVGLVDVYPTLLAYLGVAIDHRISGRSLLGFELAHHALRRLVFAESEWGQVRTAIDGRLKYHHHLPQGPYYLYDLAGDPGERADLLPSLVEAPRDETLLFRFLDLQSHLEGWMETMERLRHVGEEVELSDEEEAQLRALGYLRSR